MSEADEWEFQELDASEDMVVLKVEKIVA
jgi:hypothetical protein